MVPAPFIVVVDANVLFPLTLRDTVLRAAASDFHQLRWSEEILDEMERNLVSTMTMSADKAARLRAQMEKHFPEAMVSGYELLIAGMQNDAKDRHVVAAAVKAGAQVVTTANLKDFTPLPDGIEAQSPDEFLCNLSDLDPHSFIDMLRAQAADLALSEFEKYRIVQDRLFESTSTVCSPRPSGSARARRRTRRARERSHDASL